MTTSKTKLKKLKTLIIINFLSKNIKKHYLITINYDKTITSNQKIKKPKI